MEGLQIKFSCIILTEAWLNDESQLPNITGYTLFRSLNSRNVSDGIVVYIDSALSVSCTQLSVGGVATSLSLTFDWAGVPCELLAVYRSPNSYLSLFVDGIHSYYNNTNHCPTKLRLLAGDINCDILNTLPNSQQERYLAGQWYMY